MVIAETETNQADEQSLVPTEERGEDKITFTSPPKNKGGRPLKFQTVEELEKGIQAYFDVEPWENWTITGLAIALDTSRKVLFEYESKAEFSNTIKKAKTYIEHAYEKRLIRRGNGGDIFALKNFGWKDKQEIGGDLGLVSLSGLFDRAKLANSSVEVIEGEIIDN